MTQASRQSPSAERWQRRLPERPAASFIATCLVLLQLVTALHFALIPHRFGAGLSGFVHAPQGCAAVAALRELPAAPRAASFQRDRAHAEPESCPLGFAGAHSFSFAPSASGALLEGGAVASIAPWARRALARSLVLLGAPKTSPPWSRLAV
jgi:hypothetical protein